MSMISRKTFGMIDRRLRQALPHKSQELLGGCSVLLFGDFGQLPPVFGLPLYTTQSSSDLADQGCRAYNQFTIAFTLIQVMRQSSRILNKQFPTVEDFADYNTNRLLECGYPIAEIKAVHTGANASVLMMLMVWIHL
ncbi:PREDICTED: uncharacterized protein LOC105314962 [Amphimedon queenslandica]|uniref:ATP-dependent DNA helicase n=1 Tax=Amphimedon queenslandica TaxID=400682 RepID=A0AAN0IRM2_AMPQE|nr:PREDICTED: uncharacterized protein LOC105314962 [Amphimedon queenslandica]|eukprot:XP_011407727.1 PREDICTED: uncharacterized protein LOC105314962 [Amphimedon queenslandica]